METVRPPSSPIINRDVRASPTPSLRSEHRNLTNSPIRTPGTPKKQVKLHHDGCTSRDTDLNSIGYDSESPGNSPARRRGDLEIKCNPLCPGHRKHSLCERRDKDKDSPRPHRHECDGSHVSRSKNRERRKASQSPHGKLNFQELHGIVDAVTEGGLGTRQYHSASHLTVLKNCELETVSPGMKQRDFSMSYITDRPLTEKELRLTPLKPRSNSNSRSGSPLRVIKHSVRIERWENVEDGELSVDTMMKKFDLTGFSHNLVEIKAGDLMICELCPEVKKAGLVSGKVWVKMYGRRINLLLEDIIEIPPNQAHKASAEEGEDAVLVFGTKEGCCIT